MTTDEATALLTILLQAHQECYECARELIEEFQKAFPVYATLAQEMYTQEYNKYC